jgi:7,8-dihydropterin-6-yl-methyl-4-(beta-D-ribofuranosyl)aminobenzene 5'-phosphate synthase
MKIDISNGIESGNLKIKVLTTNTVDLTLLTEERFGGKVIQPGFDAVRTTGEHGLAMSIEIKDGDSTHHYLMDSGNVTSTIIENTKVFKVNLNDIEKLILSHGHFDHFGALIKLIPELKERCEIIINPNCYYQSHSITFVDGKEIPIEELGISLKKLKKDGIIKHHRKLPLLNKNTLWDAAEKQQVKITETPEPYKINKGITTSGEITLFDVTELTRGLFIEKNRNKFQSYLARDETSLYLNIKNKGLVILTGCSHAGIMNTIKHAQELTGIQKIYAIIGGLHKINQPNEVIDETIKFIEYLNPEITCGMHCTGFEFNKKMSIMGHPSHTLGVVGTEFHL